MLGRPVCGCFFSAGMGCEGSIVAVRVSCGRKVSGGSGKEWSICKNSLYFSSRNSPVDVWRSKNLSG